jgi:cell wall-associated NlpC family hydrolase
LPRTTYEQFSVGSVVSRSSLRPGDLVFFTTDHAGASHVAVYIGNGLIVHALNERTGVIVSRLSDAYYASRYIGARRYCH